MTEVSLVIGSLSPLSKALNKRGNPRVITAISNDFKGYILLRQDIATKSLKIFLNMSI